MRSNKQNYKAINNKLKEFEQKNTVFHCNRTPECHPALNPEKGHLNFNLELKKTETSGNKFCGKNFLQRKKLRFFINKYHFHSFLKSEVKIRPITIFIS